MVRCLVVTAGTSVSPFILVRMVIDVLLIALGCVVSACASVLNLERFRGQPVRPFTRQQIPDLAPQRRVVQVLMCAGSFVAVLGGANAQLHYIGDWALAMVFFPLLLTRVLTTAIYNRSVSG